MDDYDRVAKAVTYIEKTLEQQPTLENIAAHVDVSASHFQRIFQAWAGLSPKRFLQLLTTEKAKRALRAKNNSVLDIAYSLGLSSSSRVYDHLVTLEAVTPSEYASCGQAVNISYGLAATPYGAAFVASSSRGIMQLAFIDENHSLKSCRAQLAERWANSALQREDAMAATIVDKVFTSLSDQNNRSQPLSVLVKGTNFQVAVWRALMSLPYASYSSYSDVAQRIDKPSAVRAVGTAISNNPVAYVIPCHRVLRQSGALGGYRWGLERKKMILLRERLSTLE